MEKKKLQVRLELECPVLHKKEDVTFNVLRGAEHGGLDVTACSAFGNGEVTYGKDCIHTTPAKRRSGDINTNWPRSART